MPKFCVCVLCVRAYMGIILRNIFVPKMVEVTAEWRRLHNEELNYMCYTKYSDRLRAGRSGDRIPVGARFFVHVQTGPGAHPDFCTMGTGSFLGVKRPGRGADHPPSPSAEIGNE
jgi:hypothetical protein